ncbi:hypothetical protein BZG36_00449 [Bifiguratus adelaidae]|uniref:Dilute domain-containing protein n=1 Tax=Bifiguratus adelaidae TaxID=1938954 RepID=A0A261Y7I7_9FUNG|nr:hypothetical protein BZG36_00449 [Bifiguratus adelaidae]
MNDGWGGKSSDDIIDPWKSVGGESLEELGATHDRLSSFPDPTSTQHAASPPSLANMSLYSQPSISPPLAFDLPSDAKWGSDTLKTQPLYVTVLNNPSHDKSYKCNFIKNTLLTAVEEQDLETMRDVLKNDDCRQYVDINGLLDDEASLLVMAAKRGWVNGVFAILDAGGKVDVKDKFGWTAYRWAQSNHYPDVIKTLEQFGGRNPDDAVLTHVKQAMTNLFIGPEEGSTTDNQSQDFPVKSSLETTTPDFYRQDAPDVNTTFEDFLRHEEQKVRYGLIMPAATLSPTGMDWANLEQSVNPRKTADRQQFLSEDMEKTVIAFTYEAIREDQTWPVRTPEEADLLNIKLTIDFEAVAEEWDLEGSKKTAALTQLSGKDIPLLKQSTLNLFLPANAVFLACRYAHHFAGLQLLEQLLEGFTRQVKNLVKSASSPSLKTSCLWLCNASQLLYYLRRDPALMESTVPHQINITELIPEICVSIFCTVRGMLERDTTLQSSMIDFEAPEQPVVPHAATTTSKVEEPKDKSGSIFKRWGRSKPSRADSPQEKDWTSSDSRPTTSDRTEEAAWEPYNASRVISVLTHVKDILNHYYIHPAIQNQLFTQLTYYIDARLFNIIISDPKFLSREKSLQIRMNLEVLEDWLRHNDSPSNISSPTSSYGRKSPDIVQLVPLHQLLKLLTMIPSMSHLGHGQIMAQLLEYEELNPTQVLTCATQYNYDDGEARLSKATTQAIHEWAEALTASTPKGSHDMDRLRDTTLWLPFSVPTSVNELYVAKLR